MDRRRFIAIGASTATATLAGCVFGSEVLSAELADGETETFEAEEGDEFEVTVTVQEGDSVDVTISRVSDDEDDSSDPILEETVEDEETFDIEIDTDGEYEVEVTGGTAEVTIE